MLISKKVCNVYLCVPQKGTLAECETNMQPRNTDPYIIDFRAFEFAPGVNVILAPSAPVFPVVAVSNDFLFLTKKKRGEVIGKSFFALLTPRVGESKSDVEITIRESFGRVVERQMEDEIPLIPFDILEDDGPVWKNWSLRNVPILGDDKIVRYIISSVRDVTESVASRPKTKSLKDIENSYGFFMSAPVIIGYLRGNEFIIEFANKGLLKTWQKGPEVVGKPLFQVFPELESQGVPTLLNNVLMTGTPFCANAYPLTFVHDGKEEVSYYDFVYQPYYEDEGAGAAGIISVGYDVTTQVVAAKKIEESRKRWKMLADSMPVMVWTADETGSINFLNKRWYEYTGLAEGDSLGFGWTKSVHADDLERCLEIWNEAVRKRDFYEVELRYRNNKGEYRWMIARGVPVIDENEVEAWYGTSTDIHEKKLFELNLEELINERTAELNSKNEILDNILKHSTNGISVSEIFFDADGNVVDALTIIANDAAIKYIGLPRDLYLTKRGTFFDPNLISSPYGQACIKTLKTGEPFIMQYFLEFTGRWLELTVSKMNENHLIQVFTDVTEIKESQLKLEKSLEDLRYANANLEEFAYAASHDLKEPIRKIQYFTNRLREGARDRLNPDELTLLDRLDNSALRMQSLITDLLEYSHAKSGSVDKEPIDLADKIKLVMGDLELEIQKKGARITLRDLPIIRGSRRQIQQLFQNLISNALKYTKPGVVPEIVISASICEGREITPPLPYGVSDRKFDVIKVSDNGIGFDQSQAQSIFKIFARLHGSSQYEGSGIGLSIVKKVVEGHDGFVWADGSPGAGATFTIVLPRD